MVSWKKVAMGASGASSLDWLYVSDQSNLRRVNPDLSGIDTTLNIGTISSPGPALEFVNGYVYCGQSNNIKVVDGDTMTSVTNIALSGAGDVKDIVYMPDGYLYAGSDNGRIYQINPSTNSVTHTEVTGYTQLGLMPTVNQSPMKVLSTQDSLKSIYRYEPSNSWNVDASLSDTTADDLNYAGINGSGDYYYTIGSTGSGPLVGKTTEALSSNNGRYQLPSNQIGWYALLVGGDGNVYGHTFYRFYKFNAALTSASYIVLSGLIESGYDLLWHTDNYIYSSNYNQVVKIDPSTFTEDTTLSGFNECSALVWSKPKLSYLGIL